VKSLRYSKNGTRRPKRSSKDPTEAIIGMPREPWVFQQGNNRDYSGALGILRNL